MISHPFGNGALRCTWILTFAMLRLLAEQVDYAFSALDPATALGEVVPKAPLISICPLTALTDFKNSCSSRSPKAPFQNADTVENRPIYRLHRRDIRVHTVSSPTMHHRDIYHAFIDSIKLGQVSFTTISDSRSPSPCSSRSSTRKQ